LGIDEWAGVTADNQSCYGTDNPEMFNTAYDEFFTQQGGMRTAANFFLGRFSDEKPLDPVKNGHKARKKKRRAIRLQLANDVAALMFWRCAEFGTLPDVPVQKLSVVKTEVDIHSLV
jgi:uncharacterized protein VirK/YbjX